MYVPTIVDQWCRQHGGSADPGAGWVSLPGVGSFDPFGDGLRQANADREAIRRRRLAQLDKQLASTELGARAFAFVEYAKQEQSKHRVERHGSRLVCRCGWENASSFSSTYVETQLHKERDYLKSHLTHFLASSKDEAPKVTWNPVRAA